MTLNTEISIFYLPIIHICNYLIIPHIFVLHKIRSLNLLISSLGNEETKNVSNNITKKMGEHMKFLILKVRIYNFK